MSERERVVSEVERYWREAGLTPEDIAEMKSELDQHLVDALANHRTVDDVVGDRARFAESWASARRGRPVVRWDDVQSGKARRDRDTRRDLIFYESHRRRCWWQLSSRPDKEEIKWTTRLGAGCGRSWRW